MKDIISIVPFFIIMLIMWFFISIVWLFDKHKFYDSQYEMLDLFTKNGIKKQYNYFTNFNL